MQPHPSLAPSQPLRPDAAEMSRLWAYYVESRDAAVRTRLIAAYTPFARMLAAKAFAGRFFSAMEFGDYMQYAMVGLLESLDRFEPQRDIMFETFASARITGAILSGIEASSEIQRQIVTRKRLIRQRVASLTESTPAEPGADVFARLAELAIGLAVGFALEDSGMHQDELAHYPDNSYAGVELRQLQARLHLALERLPAQQKQVVQMHYLQQQAFTEVAANLGLSRGRIAQIHKEALASLRTLLQRSGDIDIRC